MAGGAGHHWAQRIGPVDQLRLAEHCEGMGRRQGHAGLVLSKELLGMAVGSVLLGDAADKVGRRPTILGCLLAMANGMFGAAHSNAISELLPWRLMTGLGIGGMLASINAAAAEFPSRLWRSFAMMLMVIGYPLGGVLGGIIVQRLLTSGTWHDVFFSVHPRHMIPRSGGIDTEHGVRGGAPCSTRTTAIRPAALHAAQPPRTIIEMRALALRFG